MFEPPLKDHLYCLVSFHAKMTQFSYSLNSKIIICEILDDCSDVFNVLTLGGARERFKILRKWENVGFGGC